MALLDVVSGDKGAFYGKAPLELAVDLMLSLLSGLTDWQCCNKYVFVKFIYKDSWESFTN